MNIKNHPIPVIYFKGNDKYEVHCKSTDYTKNSIELELVGNQETFVVGVDKSESVKFLPSLLSNELLEEIRFGNLFLMIVLELESFHNIVEKLYLIIHQLNIPETKVTLVTGSPDISETVFNIANRFKKKSIKVIWLRTAENLATKWLKYCNTSNTLETKNYKKKFLNFNKRWRPHRPLLVGLMAAKNLLQYGYISLGKSDYTTTWQEVYEVLKFNNTLMTCNEVYDLFCKHKDLIFNLPEMYLDTPDLVNVHYEWINRITPFYQETYFSVVSETNFYTMHYYDSARFLTDKTFKTIVAKHPFILVSPPKSLELLRSLGYKTFSPFIDETYDLEINDNKRLWLILNEIERLCNLSDKQLIEFLSFAKDIVEHNFEVLSNKTSLKDFYTKLL